MAWAVVDPNGGRAEPPSTNLDTTTSDSKPLTMGDSNFFKGTSTDQDRRFSDKETKLLKTLKFPPEFDQKVRSAC
jgi:hypothetical protein